MSRAVPSQFAFSAAIGGLFSALEDHVTPETPVLADIEGDMAERERREEEQERIRQEEDKEAREREKEKDRDKEKEKKGKGKKKGGGEGDKDKDKEKRGKKDKGKGGNTKTAASAATTTTSASINLDLPPSRFPSSANASGSLSVGGDDGQNGRPSPRAVERDLRFLEEEKIRKAAFNDRLSQIEKKTAEKRALIEEAESYIVDAMQKAFHSDQNTRVRLESDITGLPMGPSQLYLAPQLLSRFRLKAHTPSAVHSALTAMGEKIAGADDGETSYNDDDVSKNQNNDLALTAKGKLLKTNKAMVMESTFMRTTVSMESRRQSTLKAKASLNANTRARARAQVEDESEGENQNQKDVGADVDFDSSGSGSGNYDHDKEKEVSHDVRSLQWQNELSEAQRDREKAVLKRMRNTLAFLPYGRHTGTMSIKAQSQTQSNAMTTMTIAPTPHTVHFSGYEVANQEHRATIKLRNISSFSQKITIFPPKSPEFALVSTKLSKDGILAPGIVGYATVSFRPSSLADFSDSIAIKTELSSIIVPIKAARRPPRLLVPSMDMGCVVTGLSRTLEYEIVNKGGATAFQFVDVNEDFDIIEDENEGGEGEEGWKKYKGERGGGTLVVGPFSVSPCRVSLASNEACTIKVRFQPSHIGDRHIELGVKCYPKSTEKNLHTPVLLSGVGCLPSLHISAIGERQLEVVEDVEDLNLDIDVNPPLPELTPLTFSPQSVKSKNELTVNVVNGSPVPLQYRWLIKDFGFGGDGHDFVPNSDLETQWWSHGDTVSTQYSIYPSNGELPAGEKQCFSVSFHPTVVKSCIAVAVLLVGIDSNKLAGTADDTVLEGLEGDARLKERNSITRGYLASVSHARLRLSLQGKSIPCDVSADPPAIMVPATAFVAKPLRRIIKLKNRCGSMIEYVWECLNENEERRDVSVAMKPSKGTLKPYETRNVEAVVTPLRPGKFQTTCACLCSPDTVPLYVTVCGEARGPAVVISGPDIDFGLVRLGSEGISREVTLYNQDPVPAYWQLCVPQGHIVPWELAIPQPNKKRHVNMHDMHGRQSVLSDGSIAHSTPSPTPSPSLEVFDQSNRSAYIQRGFSAPWGLHLFNFYPWAGRIPPNGSTTVKVNFQPRETGSTVTALQCFVMGGTTQHIGVRALVQTQCADLQHSETLIPVCWSGVMLKATNKLVNQSLIPTPFKWIPPVTSSVYDIEFQPQSGTLPPGGEITIVALITVKKPGPLKLLLRCEVEGLTNTVDWELETIARPILSAVGLIESPKDKDAHSLPLPLPPSAFPDMNQIPAKKKAHSHSVGTGVGLGLGRPPLPAAGDQWDMDELRDVCDVKPVLEFGVCEIFSTQRGRVVLHNYSGRKCNYYCSVSHLPSASASAEAEVTVTEKSGVAEGDKDLDQDMLLNVDGEEDGEFHTLGLSERDKSEARVPSRSGGGGIRTPQLKAKTKSNTKLAAGRQKKPKSARRPPLLLTEQQRHAAQTLRTQTPNTLTLTANNTNTNLNATDPLNMSTASIMSQSLKADREAAMKDQARLSGNKGACFWVEPSTGSIEPYSSVEFDVMFLSDMFGEYGDNLVIRVYGEGDSPFDHQHETAVYSCDCHTHYLALRASVIGSPLVFCPGTYGLVLSSKPAELSWGSLLTNSPNASKVLRVKNNGPIDANVNWAMFRYFQGEKLVTLDLDIPENAGMAPRYPRVKLNISPYAPDPSITLPFTITPQRATIKAREEQVFTLKFSASSSGEWHGHLMGKVKLLATTSKNENTVTSSSPTATAAATTLVRSSSIRGNVSSLPDTWIFNSTEDSSSSSLALPRSKDVSHRWALSFNSEDEEHVAVLNLRGRTERPLLDIGKTRLRYECSAAASQNDPTYHKPLGLVNRSDFLIKGKLSATWPFVVRSTTTSVADLAQSFRAGTPLGGGGGGLNDLDDSSRLDSSVSFTVQPKQTFDVVVSYVPLLKPRSMSMNEERRAAIASGEQVDGDLQILYENGEEQHFNLQGRILRPRVDLNVPSLGNGNDDCDHDDDEVEGDDEVECPRIDFGIVHVASKALRSIKLTNPTRVDAVWTVNNRTKTKKRKAGARAKATKSKGRNEGEDADAFTFAPTAGVIAGVTGLLPVPREVSISFKPKRHGLHQALFEFNVEHSETTAMVRVCGHGSLDEEDEK